MITKAKHADAVFAAAYGAAFAGIRIAKATEGFFIAAFDSASTDAVGIAERAVAELWNCERCGGAGRKDNPREPNEEYRGTRLCPDCGGTGRKP